MKLLKFLLWLLLTVGIVLGGAWLLRSDPIGPLPGKALSGEQLPYPKNWSFSNSHMTIALESRPEAPYSVTTLCFVHEGSLYIPAQEASNKTWPSYVLADPNIRVKIGESVYPASAVRIIDPDLDSLLPSISRKYKQMADRDPEDAPQDVWFFKVSARSAPATK